MSRVDGGLASTSLVCPNCAVGLEARDQVLDDGFGFNLVFALLPFALIVAVCVVIERRFGAIAAGTRSLDSPPGARCQEDRE